MTPKEQAEQLARKCAEYLHGEYSKDWFVGLDAQGNKFLEYKALYDKAEARRVLLTAIILEHTSLQALLEVAKAAAQELIVEPLEGCECGTCKRMQTQWKALQTLREQGIEL